MSLKTSITEVVLAFLISFSAAAQGSETGNYFNVRSFGATGDGTNLDSPAINKAIAACARVGGGTVYVPAGTYLSGSIHLESNIHLLIDAGATILGAPEDLDAYDETETWSNNPYEDGGHCYFHNSLIWGENLTNISITGEGMINGGGMTRHDGLLDRMCGFAHSRKPLADYPPSRLGNKAIALKLCRNVQIRGITLFHGGHFAILVTGCDNFTMDDVTIDTDRDGIDIDSCRNVVVANSRINSPNDDGLCLKSSYALGRKVATENVTIVNCQVSGFKEGTLLDGRMVRSPRGTGRIKLGTESNGGFRNIAISNCTFRDCHGLALEEVDGGTLENVCVNNLTMMDVVDYPIYVTLGRRNRGPGATNGVVRNIQISNVIATGVSRMSGIQIMGLPGDDIDGVRLDNIRMTFNGGGSRAEAARTPPELGAGYPEPSKLGVMPAYAVFARHVRDLELADIHVSYETNDLRPAMVCSNVDGLEIDDFKAKTASGVKPAHFEDVKGLAVRNWTR